ncbi:MAG TPA: ABC transporter ATP-binding protein [Bacteroidales bacterium]|jgi:ABC-type lipoprotein export system ATPase subunit|nr:ABC transporter ATP-binding protein [Bacteroidales bacterium]HOX75644.1 ABC transporter ATP-binding protein [Bacteroidales bacterium]HPM87983.1 ABC transporter ATP-binding protein [Bacteroidales bacterium]
MLRLVNITKSFPQRGIVLDNLNLEVKEGDSIAVTGPSGSGKTTLMNIIGTLDRPDSGDVIFRDRSITTLNADESADYRNRNIGFVFQDHLLLPHLTVHENIMLPLLAYSIDKEAYAAKESDAVKLMERIGIHDLKDKYPFQISGGEAQRVTLVRALINNPSLLLADEPTGSLDATNAEVLGKLLKELNEELGITLFVVTHSSGLASEMKIHLKLKDGKLVN